MSKYKIEFVGQKVNELRSEDLGIDLTYYCDVKGYAYFDYFGSIEELKEDLKNYYEEEDEFYGVEFKNHLWMTSFINYVVDDCEEWETEPIDGTTDIISTNFDYEGGLAGEDIVGEYFEKVGSDYYEDETIGIFIKSIDITSLE